MTINQAIDMEKAAALPVARRSRHTNVKAIGEPFLWGLGGALSLGVLMITGFLLLVFWNGAITFWPKPIQLVVLKDGTQVVGEPTRREDFRLGAEQLRTLDPASQAKVRADEGFAVRTLYRTGNYDVYNEDFRWVPDYDVVRTERPNDLRLFERVEWGVFLGRIKSVRIDGRELDGATLSDAELTQLHDAARQRRERILYIERSLIGEVNHRIDADRLAVRRAFLRYGDGSAEYREARNEAASREVALKKQYEELSAEAQVIRAEDAKVQIALVEIGGQEKTANLSTIVRMYAANDISWPEKMGIYLSRWWEFLSDEPREANTEGGVLPAIFGTFTMTLLLVVFVAPFGVITALYLREYAKQGRLVSIVRISVNNLAGVPSIVYGVFGLGFFAYILGGSIDQLFFPERLPSPTFGTGGLLWSSLTLAILTVPVVIVATEEALAAVPRSMREGSLACGASKWQTIRSIVLPRAMPGIMTGLILAMARGAGEVAPLMLVGVVKLAPELPIDGFFPFIHLERSFMHLGFHIYDVGFQSRNSEAGKPMVFVTTMLLIALIAAMNIGAIVIRNRLRRKFAGSQF
ncbi:MAG: phosphate ABC transporter permease PstA [Ferrovibrio sp.]|uniref:phosphate ABC transporter permease PstA n=1 Tax=Ferrovibrio sp. TaxID=1917215 RepID=UPI00391D484D